MITQWHDPATTPLPPIGTRLLVYCDDLKDVNWRPWHYGIEVAVVTEDAELGSVAETAISLHEPGVPGWRWAFAPSLPDA